MEREGERSAPESPAAAPEADPLQHLQYIRETMERAGSFTIVSGWGQVAVGGTALAAAALAAKAANYYQWLYIWLAESLIAVAISLLFLVRKARRAHEPLWSAPARKFLLGFAPPVLAGGFLTPLLFLRAEYGMIPAVWLLMYGVGVVTGGTFSVRPVPLMGICMMALAVIAPFIGWEAGQWLLALGFGLVHIIFGIWIARSYGG